MKAKNQAPISSEIDAKEKLIVYVYEYLSHSGAKRAAQAFLEDIQYEKEIQYNPMEGPGFLVNWWCVFWDLYCAAPEKRNQPEPSSDARAFHEYNMRSVMSPHQTSPPQAGPPFMGAGGPMPMAGPRYGLPPPHPGGPMRGGPPPMGVGPPPRMQAMSQPLQPPQMGAPPHGPPPPPHPSMMSSAGSPRYAPHPGHMTPGSSASSVGPMGPEPGPSPGLANRMTPNHSSSPHPQVGGPGGMPPMAGPPGQPQMSQGGPPMQQRGGMPPQSAGGWQGNQFNVNSPADQQCFMPGPGGPPGQQGDFGMIMNDNSGMMEVKSAPNNSAPQNQQDEYVMPGAYGQQADQSDSGSEIMKLKESLESNTNEGDQQGFMDFPESQNKWTI